MKNPDFIGIEDQWRWKPIEAAPRDERIIVAKIGESGHEDFGGVNPPHVWWACAAQWSDQGWWSDGLDRLAKPSHWMRIPPIP